MYKYLFTITIFCLFQYLNAQTPTWQNSYELIPNAGNNDEGRGVISDSTGIYVVTQTWCEDNQLPCVGIIKLKPENGEVIFRKIYTHLPPVEYMFAGSDRSLLKTKDGNYLLGGGLFIDYQKAYFLLKFDENGDSLWMKTYQGEIQEFLKTIVETPEGNLLLHGNGFNDEGFTEVDITKLDSEGNVLWEQQHDFADVMFNPALGTIALTDSGEIMLYFNGNPLDLIGDRRYAHLAKFDAEGELLWVNRLYEEEFYYGEVIKKLPDGNFVGGVLIDSTMQEPVWIDNVPLITKFDPEGNILWEFIPPMPGRAFLTSLSVTEDGNILVAGTFWHPDYYESDEGWLVKISTDGELIWQRGYFVDEDPAAFYILRDVTECPDGSLVAVGVTEEVETSNYNAWVLKLDSEGCFDSNNCGSYNNLVVGIDDIPWEESLFLMVSPNPTSNNQFQLQTDHFPSNAEVRIYSPLGQLLSIEKWTESGQAFTLPHSGVFYVAVFSEGKRIATRKVVGIE